MLFLQLIKNKGNHSWDVKAILNFVQFKCLKNRPTDDTLLWFLDWFDFDLKYKTSLSLSYISFKARKESQF